MSPRLVIALLALGLVILAVGGWLAAAVRWPTRALAASV
jgi:hypothetical protein